MGHHQRPCCKPLTDIMLFLGECTLNLIRNKIQALIEGFTLVCGYVALLLMEPNSACVSKKSGTIQPHSTNRPFVRGPSYNCPCLNCCLFPPVCQWWLLWLGHKFLCCFLWKAFLFLSFTRIHVRKRLFRSYASLAQSLAFAPFELYVQI